jgi:fucose 4-O-acetylase-like acetyltransferase
MTDATTTLTVDDQVEATPEGRERVVDFTRVLCIAVVVLWHWVFSITQWRGGRLVMPNLISHVRGLWLATWVLQIMPAFFIVGGYANLASWDRTVRQGGGAREFWVQRMRRLLRPALAMLAVWCLVDLVLLAAGGASADVLRWGMVTFVPLWFLGVYSAVVLAVPVTARLHQRYGVAVPAVMVAGMVVAGNGYVTTALVWLFAHQLGYFWRDGRITGGSRRHARLAATGLLAGGIASLTLLTTVGGHPDSMVATTGGGGSNMFPTSVCIAALAVLQLGLLLLVRPALDRWLNRRRVWRGVVAANGVAMTVFCWHMTALIAVIGVVGLMGGHLLHEPTAAWWLQRPLWLLAPAAVLAGLVAVFSKVERS